MARRKQNRAKPTVPCGPWSLIKVNGHPIREKARREYERARRDLGKAQAEIERFEEHDQPSYHRWFHQQFGALLTQLREVSGKLQAQQMLLFEIESEAFERGCSFTHAYERVKKRQEQPEPAPAPEEEPTGHAGKGEKTQGDFFDSLFEEIRDRFSKNFDGMFDSGDLPLNAPKSAKVLPRLKDLYRAVVRLLHPDVQEKMTAQKLEWWHQAQAAYEEGDTDRLQVILTYCEIEQQGNTASTSVSLLKQITNDLKRTLRSLRSRLSELRRQPAWNFSERIDRERLERQTRASLQSDLEEMTTSLAAIEQQLAVWDRASKTGRRQRSRRVSSRREPEYF